MRSRILSVVAVGLMVSAPAWAGLDPANPGLPTVSDAVFAANIANNQMSAMCVDCHTRNPKGSLATGTHFVSVAAGVTNSGGSGIDATGVEGAARDAGQFFKTSLWSVGGTGAAMYSKYGDGTTSYYNADPRATIGDTADVATGVAATMEIICESCHSIIMNDAGGNNLLESQDSVGAGANDGWQNATEASLCVGCHGFMYSNAATQTGTGANAGDARNGDDFSAADKGNNEFHWVRGAAYAQNHHVMTGDQIVGTQAAAGLLWTDNLVLSYTDNPIDNTSTLGTYPQAATWANSLIKPTGGGLICTNCHAPAHGNAASAGASILRNGTYTTRGARANTWDRISDAVAWKKIDDLTFCGQCHQ